MAWYYNSNVIQKKLVPGDLVLRNAHVYGKGRERENLAPKWEESYIINEEIKARTYSLIKKDG